MANIPSYEITSLDSNDGSEKGSRPLLLVLQQVTSTISNKQNTILTNTQITNILKDEFNIDTADSHELERNIYINIIKTFLKTWPLWQQFDKTITRLRKDKDDEGIKKLVEEKYVNLKEYLNTMLDTATPMVKEKLTIVKDTVEKGQKSRKTDVKKQDDVILEISCSHSQLSSLLYNYPIKNNDVTTVFNINKDVPTKISLSSLPFTSIFNWSNVTICLNLSSLAIKRDTSHQLSHCLVNKKINSYTPIEELNQCLQKKTPTSNESMSIAKPNILNKLNAIKEVLQGSSLNHFFSLVTELFEQDLECTPNNIACRISYRRYMSKYPYVRHLYKDAKDKASPSDMKKYELEIEETIKPSYSFCITKLMFSTKDIEVEDFSKNYMRCNTCKLKFDGENVFAFYQHFIDNHMNEADWQCTNCKKVFTMLELTKNRWCHQCN